EVLAPGYSSGSLGYHAISTSSFTSPPPLAFHTLPSVSATTTGLLNETDRTQDGRTDSGAGVGLGLQGSTSAVTRTAITTPAAGTSVATKSILRSANGASNGN